MPNLERVHREMRSGRIWKARDRLHGMLGTYPRSQEIMELLGDVYFRMGDSPEAGRFWFLTERNDEAAQVAFRAFRERYGDSIGDKLQPLLFRNSLDELGPIARQRAIALIAQNNKLQPLVATEASQQQKSHQPGALPTVWRARIVTWALLVFLIAPWMAGLLTLGVWLVSLAFPSFGGVLRNWLFPRP